MRENPIKQMCIIDHGDHQRGLLDALPDFNPMMIRNLQREGLLTKNDPPRLTKTGEARYEQLIHNLKEQPA